MDVRQYLSGKGFTWEEKRRPSGLQAVMNCPFHQDTKKKFAVNLSTGAFQCFSVNKCGAQGSWYDFQRMLGDVPVRLNDDRMIHHKNTTRTYTKPKTHSEKISSKGLEYLHNRALNDEVIKKFRIGMTKDGRAIMFPYFKNKELIAIKYRNMKEDKEMWTEKDQEPVLFNRDNVKGNMLTLVEGEIDCLSMDQYGIECASIPSGVKDLRWIEHDWGFLEQFQSIYLVMDGDAAGQKAAETIATRLGRWRCYNVRLPFKDANKCLQKGVSTEEIINCMDQATDFTIKHLVSAGYFLDEIVELFHDPEKLHGIPTGFNGLDKYIKGWREEELTVHSGMNGSGKSTFLNQVIINLARQNQRCCIASLEMPPQRLLRWMVLQASKYSIITDEVVKTTISWIDDYLFIVNIQDEISPEELLNIFEYANRKYGVKHFFIDSLIRIAFQYRDELKEHKKFCSQLLSFAKSYKSHVHLVAHPRKGSSDSDRPGKVDVSGTINITNLAHNVLILWRPDIDLIEKAKEQGKKIADCVLFVKKNREWGLEGAVRFDFDAETKRFNEWN
ncbi:MAG: DnaB-like helicase C-terminal domain-containing protein [Candidatus Scalindua sp.]